MSKTLKQEYAYRKKEGRDLIVKHLITTHHIFCMDERVPEPYIYKNGYFVPGKVTLAKEIATILEEEFTKQAQNEILSRIYAMTTLYLDEITPPPHLLNLKNGIYDLNTHELAPHTPEHRFIRQIPVAYDIEATCPKIEDFINSTFQEEDVQVVYEFLGYALYNGHPIKKALILEGERHMGKTQVCNLFTNFVGLENTSSVLLQDLADNKFAPASLHGKTINIADDLPNKMIKNTGIIKILTGDGTIRVEQKFKNGFEWRNNCKLMFTCNQIPDNTNLDDMAYFSRWIIVKMNKPPEEKVLDIGNKISTPEELSGLLNLALKGLKTILANKAFSYAFSDEEVKTIMCSQSSSIASFANDLLEEAHEEFIEKDDMFEEYRKYCATRSITAESKTMLGRQLPKFVPYMMNRGKHLSVYKNVWVHVRLKNRTNQPQDTPPPPTDEDNWEKEAKKPEETGLDQTMMDLLNNN